MKLWGRKTSFYGLFSPLKDKNEDTTKIIKLNENTCLKEKAKFDDNLVKMLVENVIVKL